MSAFKAVIGRDIRRRLCIASVVTRRRDGRGQHDAPPSLKPPPNRAVVRRLKLLFVETVNHQREYRGRKHIEKYDVDVRVSFH